MRWSEPQRAMLREMGLRLWLPGAGVVAEALPATSARVEPSALGSRPAGPLEHSVPAGHSGLADSLAGAAPAAAAARPAAPARPTGITARPQAAAVGLPRSALAESILALDWPALQAAVQSCQACGLCEGRRQTVFGVGHLRAHCMVVGEAPGEPEDACGEPFVGEAGQLLDRMLRSLGLSREPALSSGPGDDAADPARQVYIAHTLKCRPPRNRNPTALELSTCQPYLERQVALVQPRVILAMGPQAVRSLLGSDEPIGKLRGRLHAWRGVPVVVSYHPTYLLRQPADKARAWDDLCLAASCLDRVPG